MPSRVITLRVTAFNFLLKWAATLTVRQTWKRIRLLFLVLLVFQEIPTGWVQHQVERIFSSDVTQRQPVVISMSRVEYTAAMIRIELRQRSRQSTYKVSYRECVWFSVSFFETHFKHIPGSNVYPRHGWILMKRTFVLDRPGFRGDCDSCKAGIDGCQTFVLYFLRKVVDVAVWSR